MATQKPNRYVQLVEAVFHAYYREGSSEVSFSRTDIEASALALSIPLPKNVGDVLYAFRYRSQLPDSIRRTAPPGLQWIIRTTGRSTYITEKHYRLVAARDLSSEELLAYQTRPF